MGGAVGIAMLGWMGFTARRLVCGLAAEASGRDLGFAVGLVAFGVTDAIVGSGVAEGVLLDVSGGCRVAARALGEVLCVIWCGAGVLTVPVRSGVFSEAVRRVGVALAVALRSALVSGVALRGIPFSGALLAVAVGSSGVGVTMARWTSLPMGAAGGGDSGWIGVAVIGIAGVIGVESATEGAAKGGWGSEKVRAGVLTFCGASGAGGDAIVSSATTGCFRCSTSSGTKITASAVMTTAPTRRWAKRGSKTESPVAEVWRAMEQEKHDGGKQLIGSILFSALIIAPSKGLWGISKINKRARFLWWSWGVVAGREVCFEGGGGVRAW